MVAANLNLLNNTLRASEFHYSSAWIPPRAYSRNCWDILSYTFQSFVHRSASKVLVVCNAFPTEYSSIVSLSSQIAKLEPGETCSVEATIRARRMASHFVAPASLSTGNSCDNVDGVKNWGILSRLDPSRWSGASKKSVSSRDTIGTDSNKSSANSRNVPKPVTVTLNFKVIYSGGAASEKGYQRELTRTLTCEIIPSAVVTKWDVIPADKVNENYLVLDIANVSEHELDLKYCATKCLTIEQGDVCRIPIPVTKFDVGTSAGALIGVRQKICSEYLEKFVQVKPLRSSVAIFGSGWSITKIASLVVCPRNHGQHRPRLELSLAGSIPSVYHLGD